MNTTLFTGAGVAIVTPFNSDGTINFDKFGELIERQIENQTDAIIVCGTTGESAAMSHEDHISCIDYCVKKVADRVPVIAGSGSNDTEYAIKLSKSAESLGANGLLCVTPYYNKTSQRGLIKHYLMIADAVNIPIILYNVPSRTGLNINPETCKVLSEHKNIVAIKEASGNLSQVAKIMALCGDDFAVYSGNDDIIVPILAMGGKGVISVMSNVCPQETRKMCQLFFDGKVAESAKMQIHYMELVDALFMDVNPIPCKDAMNLMGMNVGECKMPLVCMDEANIQKLKVVLGNYNLI